MRIFLFGALLALVFGAGFGSQANAEEYQTQAQFASTAELIGRLEAAEAQINRLENSIATGGGGKSDTCGCNECCDKTMSYAGLEIVALKVFQSEGNYGNNDYQPGVRVWAGAQRSDGLGVRVRWFDYTQSIGGDVVDIENLDLELTDAFSLGRWDGIVSGGLRYTEFAETTTPVDSFATGLTLGVQMNRDLNGRFSIFSAVQESLLYGNDIAAANDDITFSITEIQLGVQANRCMSGGATAFFRTGVEGQFYCAASDDDSESLGLFGFFATVGVMR